MSNNYNKKIIVGENQINRIVNNDVIINTDTNKNILNDNDKTIKFNYNINKNINIDNNTNYDYDEEKKLTNKGKSINLKDLKIRANQMEKCICKIKKMEKREQDFFAKFQLKKINCYQY